MAPMRSALLLLFCSALPAMAQEPIFPSVEEKLPVSSSVAAYRVTPRFTVRHDHGDGVGYDNGFTYLQSFVPIRQTDGSSVLFSDLRAVNFDNASLWEFNGGGGWRWYDETRNRVHGANLYYDGRLTKSNYYHQIGAGVESLGERLDFRVNGYIPVGDRSQLLGFANPRFQGFNILLDRLTENTLGGLDAEIGTPLPLRCTETRAFAGYYHYSGPNTPDVNGVSGRLESLLTEAVTLHFSINHDDVFGTTVNGGVALHLGGGRLRNGLALRRPRTVRERLGDRVVRDPNIVISNQAQTTTALDPQTSQPIIVRHVSSGAAAGGDGSFERPFSTLGALQAGSNPNEILFAHAGSVFVGQDITLKLGQRLLGESIPHQFTSLQGTFLLPRATSNTVLPIIADSSGDAITLASNTEVSGFDVRNAGQDGIFGLDIANVNINRNTITAGATSFSGIALIDFTDQATVTGNTVLGDFNDDSILFILSGARKATVTVKDNVVSGNVDENGIGFALFNSSSVIASVTGNRINNLSGSGADAIDVDLDDDSSGTFTIDGNTITGIAAGSNNGAIDLETHWDAIGTFLVRNNIINGGGEDAINIDANNSSLLRAQVSRNTISGTSEDSVEVDAHDASQVNLQLFQNVASSFGGVAFDLDRAAAAIFRFEDVLGTNSPPATPPGGGISVIFGTFGFPAP